LKSFLFFVIIDMVNNMSWFKMKQELNSIKMEGLIYGTVKVRNSEIEPILDRAGAIYDATENQLVVMAVNFEIMHWVLKKGNPKEIVEPIIGNCYQRFFNSLYVNANVRANYERIMSQTKQKADEILFARFHQKVPKYILIYKLILELEDIKEVIIEASLRKELELLVEGWFKVAETINNEYKIVDNKEDLEKIKPIDFDF